MQQNTNLPPWLMGLLQKQSASPMSVPTRQFQATGAGGAIPISPQLSQPQEDPNQQSMGLLNFGMGLMEDPAKRDKIMNGILGNNTPDPAANPAVPAQGGANPQVNTGLLGPTAPISPIETQPLPPINMSGQTPGFNPNAPMPNVGAGSAANPLAGWLQGMNFNFLNL